MAFMLLLRETWGDVLVFALSMNMQVKVGARVITELGAVFMAWRRCSAGGFASAFSAHTGPRPQDLG